MKTTLKAASIEDCKSILRNKLEKEYSKSEAKKIEEHSISVQNLCYIIAEELNNHSVDVNIEKLCKAALFHDIAKYKDRNNHHKNAKKILKNLFIKNEESKKYLKDVSSIIKSHKEKFEPNDQIIVEAVILRMADKIDKYRKVKN